jgi:hypothetical protein
MVVKKGYSYQQLHTVLVEYENLGVLTVDADGQTIKFL